MKCKTVTLCVMVNLIWNLMKTSSANEYTGNNHGLNSYAAITNITYKDPVTGDLKSEVAENGKYGDSSPIESVRGIVVHVKDDKGKNDGCSKPVNVPSEHWIALIKRGMCKFEEKIKNAAVYSNASAVVIYNTSQKHTDVPIMEHESGAVSIAIPQKEGEKIAALVDNGTKVWMEITVGAKTTINSFSNNINKTSVLFVSISFIVLMIISLAWLVFYYIQRFRYAHAKERLSKRLMHAARKAIAKMSSRSLKAGDKETHPEFDPCAVCIENYRSGEVVRTLPCGHIFHKSCVDPWLIEQRSCPMCKSDILKAYGLQIHSSLGSLVNLDLEAASTSIGPSELLPQSSILHSEPGIVEVLYYPNISGNNRRAPLSNETGSQENNSGGINERTDQAMDEVPEVSGVGITAEEEEEEGSHNLPEEQQSLLNKDQAVTSNNDDDIEKVVEEEKRKSYLLKNKISEDLKAGVEQARKEEKKNGNGHDKTGEVFVGLLSKKGGPNEHDDDENIDGDVRRSEKDVNAPFDDAIGNNMVTVQHQCHGLCESEDDHKSGADKNCEDTTMDNMMSKGYGDENDSLGDFEMEESGVDSEKRKENPTQGERKPHTVCVKDVTRGHSDL